jgi:hypothetical protein
LPSPKLCWPEGKSFAFTIFDDTDLATVANARAVYSFLNNCGLRTTKSVWTMEGNGDPGAGDTCDNPEYLEWVMSLQERGFEIGYHNATHHTSLRAASQTGLEKFLQFFGHWPNAFANHKNNEEGMYWGDARLNNPSKLIYNFLTKFRNKNRFRGHIPGDPLFWGDLCLEHIKYVRNFVFKDINTLKQCPYMPYHDPDRPYVKWWYASSDGFSVKAFNQTLNEKNQDRLEEEGGCCIMYTHFGNGFHRQGMLDKTFKSLMERLARKNGWFVPVSNLLDYLMEQKGEKSISSTERMLLELRWLLYKIRVGGT